MNKIVVLFSSSRRYGNTGILIDELAKNVDLDIIDLGQLNLNPFDYDNKHKGDDFLPLTEKVFRYNHIVFASPVYWYSVSLAMKIFLDRISDFLTFPELLDMERQLRNKKGYIVSTHYHYSSIFNEAFLKTFDYLGMHHGGSLYVNCGDDIDIQAHQKEVLSFVKQLKQYSSIK